MRVPVASEPPENLGQLHGLSPKRAAAIPAVGNAKRASRLPLDRQAKAARVQLSRILKNLGKNAGQPE